MGEAIWYAGICDQLLLKINMWFAFYNKGEVATTRDYLDIRKGVIPKATSYAHKIPFRLEELEQLVRITSRMRPNTALLEELTIIKDKWKLGKPVNGNLYASSYWTHVILPPGIHRVVTLIFFPEHVTEIRNILIEAKTGQKNMGIKEQLDKVKETGKDIFEG